MLGDVSVHKIVLDARSASNYATADFTFDVGGDPMWQRHLAGELTERDYWLGNAQYGQRDYKGSLATFKAFLTAAPDHPRAAEAMLAIANCQAELKDTKAAKRTLEDLIKRYPQSEAAHAAKERLVALK